MEEKGPTLFLIVFFKLAQIIVDGETLLTGINAICKFILALTALLTWVGGDLFRSHSREDTFTFWKYKSKLWCCSNLKKN